MSVTVYTVSYNEEIFVKFMVEHYKRCFPTGTVIVYDNYSSDRTVEIAKAAGAEVVMFDTGGKFSDTANVNIKNRAWKTAKTDWILTCDMDELLDINEEQLKAEEARGSTLIKSEGYALVNMEDNYDLENMKYGARCTPHDKPYLFNKKFIKEINYTHGCHNANPIGQVKISDHAYRAYHYKCVNADALVERVKTYGARMSDENLKYGWGRHYLLPEATIREDFRVARLSVTKLKD